MKVLAINSVPYGSTAKIMLGIGKSFESSNPENQYYTATGYSTHPLKEMPESNISIGGPVSKLVHMIFGRLTGLNDCFSFFSTYVFLKKIDRIKPDCIHLHNIHGWYMNIPMLFRYIKKNNIPVIWTLHDCWAFTGRCPYFQVSGCEKWKSGCNDCVYGKKDYPQALIDTTRYMWRLKKKLFTQLDRVTIVTPSEWLASLVRQSFLSKYDIVVINNGIDLNVFKPTPSDLKIRLGGGKNIDI